MLNKSSLSTSQCPAGTIKVSLHMSKRGSQDRAQHWSIRVVIVDRVPCFINNQQVLHDQGPRGVGGGGEGWWWWGGGLFVI